MASPCVTVLQLDTCFPRIAGDISCPQTYNCDIEILRVFGARVPKIVTDSPRDIEIAPFRSALGRAQGDIITTSCGFLSYWQSDLAERCPKPFIASALNALPKLAQRYAPQQLMIVTFDSTKLTDAHLPRSASYSASIVGLPPGSHLRGVIENDRKTLDSKQAEHEVVDLIRRSQTPKTAAILLECTNLPPYKAAIEQATGLPVFDILTEIESTRPGTVAARFCASRLHN